jgi:phosphatidylglycerol---prolipoprotein diacylglyceryl transferase
MLPRVAGIASYQACLLVGLAVALALAPAGARRAGLPVRRVLLAAVGLTLAALAGGKLYWLLESGRSLADWGGLWRGYRHPGALLTWVVLLPFGARLMRGVPAAGLGDALAPGCCLALTVLRIGCFLNGCCCGHTCALPWAVRFPAGADAWTHQVFARLIPVSAPLSLPVHPLQLYVALWSGLIGAAGWARLPSRRFNGEVLLGSIVLFAAGETALYGLRYQYSPMTQLVLAAITGLAAAALVWSRRRAPTRFPAAPDQSAGAVRVAVP